MQSMTCVMMNCRTWYLACTDNDSNDESDDESDDENKNENENENENENKDANLENNAQAGVPQPNLENPNDDAPHCIVGYVLNPYPWLN